MRGKTGRPATRRNIKTLVLRLARENPGYVEPGIMWSRDVPLLVVVSVSRVVSRIADASST
jgi:hypothetical protein